MKENHSLGEFIKGAVLTASANSTYKVLSELNYCESLLLNLKSAQFKRLQLIPNSLASAVVKHHRITGYPQISTWLQISERIQFIALSLTSYSYNILSLNSVFNSSPSRQSTPPASTLGSSILSFPTELYQTLYTRSLNDRLHEFRKFSSTVIANHPPESTSRSSVN